MTAPIKLLFAATGNNRLYDIAQHLLHANPHPQYALRSELNEGVVVSGDIQEHIEAASGSLAHSRNVYMFVADLMTIEEAKSHPAVANRAIKASDIVTLNDAYQQHIQAIAQGDLTKLPHKDTDNQELYARRIHSHNAYAPTEHNHDDRYITLSYTLDELITREQLTDNGLLDNILRLEQIPNPEYRATDSLDTLLTDYSTASLDTYVYVYSESKWYRRISLAADLSGWTDQTDPSNYPQQYLLQNIDNLGAYQVVDINTSVFDTSKLPQGASSSGILKTYIQNGDKSPSVQNCFNDVDDIPSGYDKTKYVYINTSDNTARGWYKYISNAWTKVTAPNPSIPIFLSDNLTGTDTSIVRQFYYDDAGRVFTRQATITKSTINTLEDNVIVSQVEANIYNWNAWLPYAVSLKQHNIKTLSPVPTGITATFDTYDILNITLSSNNSITFAEDYSFVGKEVMVRVDNTAGKTFSYSGTVILSTSDTGVWYLRFINATGTFECVEKKKVLA